MPDTHFELTYGIQTQAFTVPAERLSQPLVAPRKSEPVSGEISEILRRALSVPVGRPPLRELAANRCTAVVMSDEFRAGLQHEILDALLQELIAGRPGSITVLCATGTHQSEIYAKQMGQWVASAQKRLGVPIDFEAHDSENSTFVDLGTTSQGTVLRVNGKLLDCDLRIYGHESKHHYLNGYSCIDKQITPGLSCGSTVMQNHKLALHPDSMPGRSPWHPDSARKKNPFAEDTREARQISEQFVLSPSGKAVRGNVVTFGLDMVSAGGKVYWIRAGDPEALCKEMVEAVDRLMAFEVKRAQYVVISPGGPPASQALYGAQNSFDLALKGAIRLGGEALVIAPLDGRPDLPEDVRGLAPDRRSKDLFWDNLVRLLPRPLEEARREITEKFALYLWKTDRVLRLLKEDGVNISIFSKLPGEILRAGGFEVAANVQEWINQRVRRDDGLFTVIDHGDKLCVMARD